MSLIHNWIIIVNTLNCNCQFSIYWSEYTPSLASVSMLLASTVLQSGTLTRLTHMSTSVSTRSLDCPPYVRFWDMRDIKLAHTHTHTQHTHTHTQNELLSLAWLRPNMNVRSKYICIRLYVCTRVCRYIWICICGSDWVCECVKVNPLLLLLSLYRTFGPFNMSHNNCDWGLFRIHLNMN